LDQLHSFKKNAFLTEIKAVMGGIETIVFYSQPLTELARSAGIAIYMHAMGPQLRGRRCEAVARLLLCCFVDGRCTVTEEDERFPEDEWRSGDHFSSTRSEPEFLFFHHPCCQL
jgi:hypothetical protein